jgi:2-dehydropantoate 2-reductase
MNILVIGAGVLGSLYAAYLSRSGNKVSLLARGERLTQLREHGLVVEKWDTGEQYEAQVNLVETLAADDAFDLVLVLVRKNQVDALLPMLAANRATPNILFMVNNAEGYQPLVNALGAERVLLGFPGAGGTRIDHVIQYHIVEGNTQPITMGEIDGSITPRLKNVAAVFESAGLPTSLSTNMDAWLKTHVALVSPIANALYLAGGDNYRLSRTPDGIVLMVRAVKEGLAVLNQLDIPITPAKYRVLSYIPEPILIAVMRKSLNTQRSELLMARHANHARDEMGKLADEFHQLALQSGVSTPAMDYLRLYITPDVPALPENNDRLAVDWRGVWKLLAGLATLITGGIVVAHLLKKDSRG